MSASTGGNPSCSNSGMTSAMVRRTIESEPRWLQMLTRNRPTPAQRVGTVQVRQPPHIFVHRVGGGFPRRDHDFRGDCRGIPRFEDRRSIRRDEFAAMAHAERPAGTHMDVRSLGLDRLLEDRLERLDHDRCRRPWVWGAFGAANSPRYGRPGRTGTARPGARTKSADANGKSKDVRRESGGRQRGGPSLPAAGCNSTVRDCDRYRP